MPVVAAGPTFAPDVTEARLVMPFDDVARAEWTTVGGEVIRSIATEDIAALARAILAKCAAQP